MPKLNWNDINDSDSSLESEPEEIQAKKDNKNQISNAKKDVYSNLKAACDQYSSEKLQRHQSENIWLYITNSYRQKADDIDDFLVNSNIFTQVLRLNNVGWNVQTSFQKGKQLIFQGMKQGNLSIKFVYSKRNEQKSGKEKKVTYVQKGKEPILHKYHTFTEETQKNNGPVEEQDLVSPKTKGQKPKNKWIEKSTSFNSNNDSKRFDSPKTPNHLRDYKSPKRYVQKMPSLNNEPQQIPKKEPEALVDVQVNRESEKKQTLPSSSQQKEENQVQKVEKQTEKNEKKSDSLLQKETSLEKKELVEAKEEEESEESEKQQKKKKQKKKREGKAKKQQKSQKKDSNPFSYFSRF